MFNHNEQALLSVVIADNTLFDSVSFLSVGDFSQGLMQDVFAAIGRIIIAGNKADFVTIVDEIKSFHENAYSVLYDIINVSSSAENVLVYAENILRESKKRKALSITQFIVESVNKSGVNIDDVIASAQKQLADLELQSVEEIKPFGFLGDKFLELLDKRMHAKDGMIGISTGFQELDLITNGFQEGQLIVLGARPGNGKTTLATNIAMTEVNNGGSVAFFTLEMTDLSLFERLVASEAGIDAKNIKSGQVDNFQIQEIVKTIGKMKDKKMFLRDALNVEDVGKQCRQIKKQYGLSFIVVDYLGLLLNGKHEHAHLVLGEITRALKKLALKMNVPILLLSQLNREVDKRGDGIPKLSDLRQSGNIEQDADIVMFISQEDKDNSASPVHGYGLITIAKHRNGELASIILGFEGHKNRFVNTTMTFFRYDELMKRKKEGKPKTTPGFDF